VQPSLPRTPSHEPPYPAAEMSEEEKEEEKEKEEEEEEEEEEEGMLLSAGVAQSEPLPVLLAPLRAPPLH